MNSSINDSDTQETLNESNPINSNGQSTSKPKYSEALSVEFTYWPTQSVIKDLEGLKCYYNDLHGAWSCPLDSLKGIQKIQETYKLKCSIEKRTVQFDPKTLSPRQRKIIKAKNSIFYSYEQVMEKEQKLRIAIERYNPLLTYDEFSNRPLDNGSPPHFQREMDFHKRYVKIEEIREQIEQKKHSLQMLENDSFSDGIIVEPGKLHEAVDAAEKLLIDRRIDIYQRAGRLVRITTAKYIDKKFKIAEDGNIFSSDGIKRHSESVILQEVDSLYMTEVLTKATTWLKTDARTEQLKSIDCPDKVAKHLVARKQWNLPVLKGVIQAPTMLLDGTLIEKEGYDDDSGLFLYIGGVKFPKIPDEPSMDDALKALELINSLLEGFPFDGEESRSVAISIILTALVRKSIDHAPMHAITAPKMASGKSLLASIAGLIATGKTTSMIPQADNEPEERKRIMAVLLEGDPVVCYDNIEKPFSSSSLCTVLTEKIFKDRILGQTGTAAAPTTETFFLATGNNLVFLGDISTRVLLCKIDSEMEDPGERIFKTDLRQFILENRGEIVKAGLTILKAYVHAGRPKQDIKQYGRFEEWSSLVRSSIVWMGLPDPYATRKEVENADPVRVSLGNLLQTWFDVFDNQPMLVKNVVKKIYKPSDNDNHEAIEALKDCLIEIASDGKGGINELTLSNKLKNYKGRIENGLRFEIVGTERANRPKTWRVKKLPIGSLG